MNSKTGSILLIAIGVILLSIGVAYPFILLVVDNTPPVFSTSLMLPLDGGSYTSLDSVWVCVYDSESGIASVKCTIGSTTYTLSYVETSGGYEKWKYTLPSPITASGTYSFTFTATNNAGLSSTKSGTFYIYTALQGKWYVNNIEITSSDQKVYSTSTTVTFKFQKTSGIEDSKITCTIIEGSSTILTLSLTDSTNHIWTGSYTFSAGTHNLQLKANDGTNTLIYSIVGLEVPGAVYGLNITTQQMLLLSGVILSIAGFVLYFRKKK